MPKRAARKGHHYLADMEGGVVLDASREGSLMCYVNSSCDPNALFVERVIDGRAALFYVSTRFIKAGEDITTAYRDGTWKGVCRCRKPGCLGSISCHTHDE
eukprot:2784317-Rhodomonas_salina.1